MFVTGNLLSIAVIISVMARLVDACFNEYSEGDDGDDNNEANATFREEPSTAYTKLPTKEVVFVALTYGLMVEMYFSIVLSAVYRSPLGLLSVHKILPEAFPSTAGIVNVCVVAPLSWALIYMLGSVASQYVSRTSSCVRQGGSALDMYLKISCIFMAIIGGIFLVVALVGLRFSLGSHGTSIEGRGAKVRNVISQYVLTDCLLLGVFWQIQMVVWAYHTGGVGLVASVVASICAAVGGVLTTKGSLAPALGTLHTSLGDPNTPTLANGV